MAKTPADYTEAEFAKWIGEIIDYGRTDETFGLDELLKNYEEATGEPVAHAFVRYINAVTKHNHRLKLDNKVDVPYTLPDAKDVVAGVKAWCLENKAPCITPSLCGDLQTELTHRELTDLVSKMLGDDPIRKEDFNLYYRVVDQFGAPDFLDVPKGTPVGKVVNHICQWHLIHRKTTFS